MKVLILAAGMGERLRPLTNDCPKALVRVAGKTLLERVFDFINHPSVTEIGIVGGYRFDVLSEHLKRQHAKTPKRQDVFCNPYFTEGSVRTLITACDFLDTDFLLMNTDHIYPQQMMDSFIKQQRGITAACDFDRKLGPDDMKVKLDNGENKGNLTKIRKDLKEYDCGYIGMSYIPREELANYKKAVFDTYEICGPASPVEFVLGHMAANGHKISVADLSGFGWLEVDTIEDLEKAEKSLRLPAGCLAGAKAKQSH